MWSNRSCRIEDVEIVMIVNLSAAKAHLSQLVDRAYHGEAIVIAKNNLPLIDMVPHKPKGKRKLGLLAGKFSVSMPSGWQGC